MKSIAKFAEPVSLARYRANRTEDYTPTYANLPEQELYDLRNSLVPEQGGICCYCMGRIKPTGEKMKIEHWQAQSQDKYPARQLDYTNLLGACLGGEKRGRKSDPKTHHCDTRKRDDDFCINPSAPNSNIESRFRYLRDGTIESDDEQLNQEINTILNLNYSLLKSNRAGVLIALKKAFGKRQLRRADLQKLLADWKTPPLKPYCQVAISYLHKKLSQSNA